MAENNNVVSIHTSLDTTFFKYWMLALRMFHKLSPKETEVAACLIKHRYLLQKHITDEELLDKVVMSDDTRKQILSECNLKLPHYQVILSKLKQHKVIEDGKIAKKYIPHITEEHGRFRLLFFFTLQ